MHSIMTSEVKQHVFKSWRTIIETTTKRWKALKTVMKSKHNKQGHGPLSHIKVLLLHCSGVVLGNVFSNWRWWRGLISFKFMRGYVFYIIAHHWNLTVIYIHKIVFMKAYEKCTNLTTNRSHSYKSFSSTDLAALNSTFLSFRTHTNIFLN